MRSSFIYLVPVTFLGFGAQGGFVDKSRFSYYNMPTPASGPCDMAPGPDGFIYSQEFLTDNIARLNPNTSVIEEYKIPYKTKALTRNNLPNIKGRTPFACSVQFGADGNLYTVTGLRNELAQFNPRTKKIKVFSQNPPNPFGTLDTANDLSAGKYGVYFTQPTANVIGAFHYKTQKITIHKVPTALALPIGIYVAHDQGVWVLEFTESKLARLNVTTNEWKIYQLPASMAQPIIMRVQHGKYLYFTCVTGNGIGRFNMETEEPDGAFIGATPLIEPGSEIADGRGNVWYSSLSQNVLGKLNIRTKKTEIIRLPLVDGARLNPPTLGLSLTYGPDQNSIFFPSTLGNRIGRLQL